MTDDLEKLKNLAMVVAECHTHPGKERTLNESRDCYSSRMGHLHIIIDSEKWQAVRKCLLEIGILGG